MNRFLAGFLSFFLMCIQATAGNRCVVPQCLGKPNQSKELCIIAQKYPKDVLYNAAINGACGYYTDRYFVNNEEEVVSLMRNLKKNCYSISKINFHGHSSEGFQAKTSLKIETMDIWKEFSCMMEDDIVINIHGCNFGRNCKGTLAVHKMASTMLESAKGTITAPMFYAVTYVGMTPYFSLDGRYRELTYNPQSVVKEQWDIKGLSFSDGGSVAENCRDEVRKLVRKVRKAKKKADKKGCYVDNFFFGEKKLKSMEWFVDSLKPEQLYDHKKIYDLVKSLDYQVFNLNDCRPEEEDVDEAPGITN